MMQATGEPGMAILPRTHVISIIDDNDDAREATGDFVRSLGYRTLTYASAEDFLDADSMDGAACLITDVQMPGLSGIELQDLLVARGCVTPIIFITGFPDAAIEAQAIRAGAVGFLRKPFSEESLIDCIDTALKRQGRGPGKATDSH